MTHSVRWGTLNPWRKGRFGGQTPTCNLQLQIAAATWQIEIRSSSILSQITLHLVQVEMPFLFLGGQCKTLKFAPIGIAIARVRTLCFIFISVCLTVYLWDFLKSYCQLLIFFGGVVMTQGKVD